MRLSKKTSMKKILFFLIIILLFFCSYSGLNAIEIGRLLTTNNYDEPNQFFTGATHTYMMKSNTAGLVRITKINRDNGLISHNSRDKATTYDLSWSYYDNFKIFKIQHRTYIFFVDYRTFTGYIYPMDNYGRILIDGPFIDTLDLDSNYWTDTEFFTIDDQYYMLFYDNTTGNVTTYNITNDAFFTDTPVETTTLYPGVDNIEFYTAGGQIFVCFHDEETSNLDFRRMNTDGTIGASVCSGYYISPGWSDIEFYTHDGQTKMILLYPYDGWIRIHQINDDGSFGIFLEELMLHTEISSVKVYPISPYREFKNLLLESASGTHSYIYEMNPDLHNRINLSDTFQTPPNLYLDTYSINDYPGDYWWEEELTPHGYEINHLHADEFAHVLTLEISENFPAIDSKRMIIKKDEEVTKENYYSYTSSDFVYFSGFGNNDTLCCYDQIAEPDDMAYGNITKWVIHDSPFSLANDDPLFYFPMFNGVHAIFGYASNYVREYIILEDDCCAICFCPYGLYGGSSKDASEWFPNSWINNLNEMWEAYRDAICISIYHNLNFGIEAAVVYLRGRINDTWFNGSRERLAPREYDSSYLIYDGPVPLHSMDLVKATLIFGTPTY